MIAADVRLRSELALCHQHGMPHSEFLSWSDLDQDKALAFQAFDRSVCKGCGTRPDEWDPDAGGDRRVYGAAVDVCEGCRVRGDLEHELREQAAEQSGLQIVLLPRAEIERRDAERNARLAARAAAAG